MNGNKKNLSARRLLALLLALTMLAGMSLFLTDCKKGSEEEPTGLRDHVDQKQETEATQVPVTEETAAPSESQLAEDIAPISQGWYVREDGSVQFYQNGEPVKGFFNVGNEYFTLEIPMLPGWYFFDDHGIMQKDCWVTWEDNFHLLSKDGLCAMEGWYSDETGWYCLGEKGMLLCNTVVEENGVTYKLNAEGYLYEAVYAQITVTSEKGSVSGKEDTYLVLANPVSNCSQFSFDIVLSPDQAADKLNKWDIWVRVNGEWVDMKGQFNNSPIDGQVTITFHEVQSFDAIFITSPLSALLPQSSFSAPTVLNHVTVWY